MSAESRLRRVQRELARTRRERDKLASAITAHRLLWATTGESESRTDRDKPYRLADEKLYARLDEVREARLRSREQAA